MIFPGSRYQASETFTVTLEDGRQAVALKPHAPNPGRLLGYYLRKDWQRLDHLAAKYLSDPTAFWKLADTNNSMSPDALGARARVGIPAKE